MSSGDGNHNAAVDEATLTSETAVNAATAAASAVVGNNTGRRSAIGEADTLLIKMEGVERGTAGAGGGGIGAGGAGIGCVTGKSQAQQTPRFTPEEKEVLYTLFHHHEEVIDIKCRKKSRSKLSVRDAWEEIVNDFNSHPNISAIRNLKQIQKFWLNARLRKQYPFCGLREKRDSNGNSNQVGTGAGQQRQHQNREQQHIVNGTVRRNVIKSEPDFQINAEDVNDNNDQSETYEEIELDGTEVVTELEEEEDPVTTPITVHHQQQQVTQQQQQQQQQQHHQQQQQSSAQVQQQLQQVAAAAQINVDQISAEKLTLNDLLQFKNTRPRDEIILQIKHPNEATGSQIAIPSPTRITIPTHHQPQQHTMATITTNNYNQQLISEIKPQQITLAQYQAQQQLQQQQQQHHHQQLVAHHHHQQQQHQLAQHPQLAVIQQQPHTHSTQQSQHQQTTVAVASTAVKMQMQPTPVVAGTAAQFVSSSPTFACTTFSALPNNPVVAAPQTNVTSITATPQLPPPTLASVTATPIIPSNAVATLAANNTTLNTGIQTITTTGETYDDKINYYKLKEAELRYKEQQVAWEKKRIELNHAQDSLKHMREIQRLQIEEMRVKIRILHEEEKRLMKTELANPSLSS